MMRVVHEGAGLGARIEGLDLARTLEVADFRAILRALGDYGVLCFPRQALEPDALAAFGAHFGALEINVANRFHAPGLPEVMILSNMEENGRAIGFADAGQDWHTDLSYSAEIALATMLHAKRVPVRDGRPLGDTQFRDMHRAWADLPAAMKARIDGLEAVHDFAKFWDMMRARPGSARKPLSPRQREERPPVRQPLVRVHPITGKKVLYCNPGYAVRIAGLEENESGALLDTLFRHQAQDKYLYAHRWSEGDVLMWDDIGTTHNAVADYGPDEPRFMYRVQMLATLDYARLVA
ncbi:MAG TPA: TauD/TfdA family dioxygenase [Stellaceae bacterium]|nr:TauD/TfdA family dioxygenase [Stellaceae bacterium]